jgi:hypothetical protein
VAQELSNLQAIRRMSMDVVPMDPDLPSFDSGFRVPPVAPSHNADEEDPSRLFWVPARLHPELAPREFKTFIQERAKTIRRSSLSQQALAQDGGGSLRRRKSMLSRQIDDDGERLERRDSNSRPPPSAIRLDELADDPSSLVRRMSIDRLSLESGPDGPDDMPMLPAKPGGQTLKRSTRTQYRRGSLKKQGMVGRRQTLRNSEESGAAPLSASGAPQLPIPDLPDLAEFSTATFGLTRVNTDPTPTTKSIENFSRPVRRAQTPPTDPKSWAGFDDLQSDPNHRQNGRRPTSPPQLPHPIPEIVVQSDARTSPPSSSDGKPVHMPVKAPERSSSMEHPSPPPQAPLPRPGHRPASRPQSQPAKTGNRQNVTLDDIAAHPAMVPGNSNRVESLSVIPTYAEEKKPDKKKSKESKSSWGWFSGGSSDDKEREKREKEELAKKNKSKLQKPNEKHETARLDVLQSSIDGTRGRESGVFDRQSLSIDDAKRGKPAAEPKKENIFSSLFGSSKRKSDKEAASGKKGSSLRGLSPDPGPKLMRPDIDYHWTRFAIHDERAIYRLAHIKLANPRRELYSQVLLSNFMYSYLAKVQQMHPQINIPQSAAQKQAQRQERQAQAKQQEEERKAQQERQAAGRSQSAQSPEELAQYQRYQEVGLVLDRLG